MSYFTRIAACIFFFSSIGNAFAEEGCTIGVAAGKATSDGRPLLWKTRDTSATENEVVYETGNPYSYVAVITAGYESTWMGVNEEGFAIVNSLSSDLNAATSGLANGTFMQYALIHCATVADFINLLNDTDASGRKTRANFGVIDATGAAAVFEASGYSYRKYDAEDTEEGYVLRTNFAFSGDAAGGLHDGIYSIERYRRQEQLIRDFYAADELTHEHILRRQMRDFSDANSDPVAVPYLENWAAGRPKGYVDCSLSICRSTSVSASVIHGVLPEESPRLTTMWTILGQPAAGIAVPYWPVGNAPNTAPLCDAGGDIKDLLFDIQDADYIDTHRLRDETGDGLWAHTFPAEDAILTAAADHLTAWRAQMPPTTDILGAETQFVDDALVALQAAYTGLITGISDDNPRTLPAEFYLCYNYPNPFNAATTIDYALPARCSVQFSIHDAAGNLVESKTLECQNAGFHSIEWNADHVSSGVYIYRLKAYSEDRVNAIAGTGSGKMIVLK